MARCFVIQPFDRDKFDRRYDETFKPAIEETGYEAYRVDEDPGVEIPIEQIEKGIREAAVCFAEITTDKPNVWYELGYAFASRKPVVMVCERNVRPKFPFDVQHRNITLYDTGSPSDYETLKVNIIARLKAINKAQLAISELTKEDQKHELDLRFVPKLSQCYWGLGKQGDQPIVQIVTHWHVTNAPGSGTFARLLETLLLEPQGELIQRVIHPTTYSPKDVYCEEITEGQTAKFTISFFVKIPEPTNELLRPVAVRC